MSTVVYMVRHGESPKEGNERTRGLTEKGSMDALQVTEILKKDKRIDVVVSSPYIRSILTVKEIAEQIGHKVLVFEDLRERNFSSKERRLPDSELLPILEESFIDMNYFFEGGESNADCQKRAISVFKELLDTYRDKEIVIGTHGVVMTLMMRYFDRTYDLNFLLSTSKPDIYRMEFNEQQLVHVERIWERVKSVKERVFTVKQE
ncbi:histidine phosphatase family protein [Jeotgalibacillus sp. ET6]|uniref:histidine phosphatase family protein n=1 Tax=Jeotgalibacillus sp. ET6 TaxID=3037260 RepID=UPI002418780C|nr:histidine phosphatase family protein [Jeotgalibacillus sp. ET6]MDG5471278.1 histidine phosphatase family protein [Jeotgalibacillus sp. ET6]